MNLICGFHNESQPNDMSKKHTKLIIHFSFFHNKKLTLSCNRKHDSLQCSAKGSNLGSKFYDCPTDRTGREVAAHPTRSKKKKGFPKESKLKTDAVSPSIMLARAGLLLKNRHSICFELLVTWLLYISMPYFAFRSLLIVLHNLHSAKIILIYTRIKGLKMCSQV